MAITPTAIQDLLDELEASKQSRSRAWNVLQRFRTVLSEVENVSIPPPAQKTFEAKGETLERALRNLPSPKRCDENSLFLSPSLSRRYNQGGMQTRLSPSLAGVVESPRSGGGSDSKLSHVWKI
jgi:hypothetical protein